MNARDLFDVVMIGLILDRAVAALVLPAWIVMRHRNCRHFKEATAHAGNERTLFVGLTILFATVGFEGPFLIETLRFWRCR